MAERKRKYTTLIACLIGICILGLAFSGNAFAKKKVRLNVGFGSEEMLSTLQTTPFQNSEMGSVYWQLVYDQLWVLGPGPDYDPLPALATHWETEDYQTWRFHLVKDAKFHDGKPVTAEDVAFTLWYLPRDPVWFFPSNDIDAKSDIKIIDKHTIEFKLARPFPGKYPPADWMPILPKHIWYEHKGRKITQFANKKAIGSGPFKLKKFKPSQYIWMVKNTDYWGEQPHVDEVVFKGYGTEDALKLAMENREKQVVFFGIGFETTAPTIAAAIQTARKMHLNNFSVYAAHKTVPPALLALGCNGNNTTSARCGNGIAETGEICDGVDLQGASCVSVGTFTGGVLGCSADCTTYDVALCTSTPNTCGNGAVDTGEVCDGAGRCVASPMCDPECDPDDCEVCVDGDCAEGFTCTGLWPDGRRECVPDGGSCASYADCPVRQVCASPREGGAPSCQVGYQP